MPRTRMPRVNRNFIQYPIVGNPVIHFRKLIAMLRHKVQNPVACRLSVSAANDYVGIQQEDLPLKQLSIPVEILHQEIVRKRTAPKASKFILNALKIRQL